MIASVADADRAQETNPSAMKTVINSSVRFFRISGIRTRFFSFRRRIRHPTAKKADAPKKKSRDYRNEF
jgi:hypothetical protein